MADFDQTQSELDQFLDQQFSQPASEEPAKGTEQPQDDEVDISEYLTGDDDELPQEQPAGLTQPAQAEPTQNANVSSEERLIALERELAATKARAEMYETAVRANYERTYGQQQPTEPQHPTLAYSDDELAVDERFEADYGDANPYIQSIARRVANDLYQRAVVPLQQKLDGVTSQLEAQRGINDQNQKFAFETELRKAVPDLDEIAFSNEWQSYLKQPAPYTGGTVTIAQVVQSGIQSGNMKQVVEVIEDFKGKRQRSQPQTQQVAPGRSQTTQPVTASRGQKVLKMSDFERATANFQAGKLSWDKYQRITDEFNAAMVEGRVNTNR